MFAVPVWHQGWIPQKPEDLYVSTWGRNRFYLKEFSLQNTLTLLLSHSVTKQAHTFTEVQPQTRRWKRSRADKQPQLQKRRHLTVELKVSAQGGETTSHKNITLVVYLVFLQFLQQNF